MSRTARVLFSTLLFLAGEGCLPAGAAAQSASPTPAAILRIPRVSRPPRIEDFLNGTPREAEVEVRDFRQREPGDGVAVSQETTAYLSYDDRNLYVVFVCKDESGKVRARLSKREDVDADDLVGVVLDTFHDRQRAYIFAVNPLGIQLDGITTEGQDDDYSFDTLWHSDGQLTADGYVAWISIPFRSLRFPDGPAQTWGIALHRALRRNREEVFWPYITRRIEGFAQQMGTLEGLERISPGRNLQFIPYGIFSRARFLDAQGPRFRTDTDARGGLDAKIVLRDALTLDIALNPDFSQVESDEPQVTINQRFEVFFPEKRPFFIENAGFFSLPINLFFSRRIADPQFGLRLTGKVGRWALGGIAIDDRAPGRRVPPGSALRDERAAVGIARVRREFGKQSGVGLLVTSRDFASSSNRVFSLDTRLKLDPNWVLVAQLMRSYTRQLDGMRIAGPAYWVDLSRTGRNFVFSSRYSDRSPDFRSELGFVRRVDIRQTENYVRYYWRPKNSRVLVVGPEVFTLVNWNRRGEVQDWIVDASFGADFRGPTGAGCSREEVFELFRGYGFRKHRTDCGADTAWLGWLELTADYGWGTEINFFPGSGLTPFLANSSTVKAGFALRPSPRFRFDQTYIYTRLGTRRGSSPSGTPEGTTIFNNHILRATVNYQFTRALSLRAILDYNATLANPALVDLGGPLVPTKRFTMDVLLTFLLNPGTAVYAGYTDNYQNLTVDPTLPPALRRTPSPNVSTGRQFFLKASYLFRF